MIDYVQFPGLAGVYLEDSYVLSISEAAGQLTFELDAVLTPDSPVYQAPRPGEQYCYAKGKLIFPNVVSIEWVTRSERRFTDASGEQDLGNVDVLAVDGQAFIVEGDWGKVRVVSDPPQFAVGV